MIDILHSFGAGIAFAVGVTVGAILCRIATREGRKEITDDWKQHQAKVEDRLSKYVVESGRMATALEMIAKDKGKLS
jgi:uncharacterized membrane-anchored protein YhcB (DUF1043 family)